MLPLNKNATNILRSEISQNPSPYFSRLRSGELLKPIEYELLVETTKDARIQWWREARFGLFITYGLYSGRGKGEWEPVFDGISKEEYE
ncbi:MAG: hypothetical protein J6S76_08110 [Clostridia bacterium]|nr:hypothetical protein [Clostridia bacterium]